VLVHSRTYRRVQGFQANKLNKKWTRSSEINDNNFMHYPRCLRNGCTQGEHPWSQWSNVCWKKAVKLWKMTFIVTDHWQHFICTILRIVYHFANFLAPTLGSIAIGKFPIMMTSTMLALRNYLPVCTYINSTGITKRHPIVAKGTQFRNLTDFFVI
jgi:hypothetical protein